MNACMINIVLIENNYCYVKMVRYVIALKVLECMVYRLEVAVHQL